MSRSDTGDRRFRVFCDACNDHDQQPYPNSIVAASQAERHDDRVHDGEETADVEVVTDGPDEPEIVTDGGFETVDEIAPEADRVDPTNLPDTFSPAIVQFYKDAPAFVAHNQPLAGGWLRVRQWDGERKKVPPHRIAAVSEVRTERNRDAEASLRVADAELREEARAVYPDQVDGFALQDDEVDRGRGVVSDGGGDA